MDKERLEIEELAKLYQQLTREIKILEARAKPLRERLLAYARSNKHEFDGSFQLKFPNGTYISLRVSDILEGEKEAKRELLMQTGDEYAKIDLDERAVLQQAPQNDYIRKLLTKLGLQVSQKETYAIYSN